MKWKSRTSAIIMGIFTASLIGSIIFSFGMINLEIYDANVLGQQVYTIQPYMELAYILVSLLVITMVMLFLIKRRMSRMMTGIFGVVSFFVLIEFFSVVFFTLVNFIGQITGLLALAAALLSVVYYFKYAGNAGRNLINVFIFITIGSVIAMALGPIPALILIGVIAVYDYISVFITKHMVTLAKGLGEKGFLAGITLSAKRIKEKAMLGGGDIVFPAVLINAVFFWYSAYAGLLMLGAAVLGLGVILVFGKRGKVYPAMAVIGPMQILFFGIYTLVMSL